jgi:hypothetical protein
MMTGEISASRNCVTQSRRKHHAKRFSVLVVALAALCSVSGCTSGTTGRGGFFGAQIGATAGVLAGLAAGGGRPEAALLGLGLGLVGGALIGDSIEQAEMRRQRDLVLLYGRPVSQRVVTAESEVVTIQSRVVRSFVVPSTGELCREWRQTLLPSGFTRTIFSCRQADPEFGSWRDLDVS